MIRLTLPWPPSMNSLYPSSKSGRRFLSQKGKAYQEAVKLAVAGAGIEGAPLPGRLGYHLVLSAPDRRTRDLSNHQKAVEDCLTKCGVWEDDSQVDYIEIFRGPTGVGTAKITIWDLHSEVGP